MHTSRSGPVRSARRLGVGVAALALVAAAPIGSATARPTASASGTPASAAIAAVAKAGGCTTTTSTEDVPIPGNVDFYQGRHSLLGLHRWYRQVKGGAPVAGGWWGWHRDSGTGDITVNDCRVTTGKLNATTPKVQPALASHAAAKAASGSAVARQLMVLPLKGAGTSRLVWAVTSVSGSGARMSYVDAVTGRVVKTVLISTFERAPKLTSGTARVFDPNPVVKLQDESLRDHHDAADAVPPHGYSNRPLPRLKGDGSTLVGEWATITNTDRVTSPTATYTFNRSNNDFEQVMGYYSLDSEQAYLQRLGFHDVNAESQRIQTDAFAADNSFYVPGVDIIKTGTGGVDDAEDPEVVWHEYGHAVQDDQIPNWGLRYQGASIGEGFGDYMAVTMSQQQGQDTPTTPAACVMDWDATSYTDDEPHCLRPTDSTKVWPDDADPGHDPHIDGEIWSAALWDMNQQLGRNTATTIIIEAQFWMTPKINFAAAAQQTVDAATELYPNDTSVADTVRAAFSTRGLLPPV